MSAAESWFAPAAVAQPLPRPKKSGRASSALPTTLPARSRSAPASAKPKTRKQSGRSFRVRASLVWMVALALLLVGVVAVNVAVLRANVSVHDLDSKIVEIGRKNATLAGHLARKTAAPGVEAAARAAGLVLAPGLNTRYLDMLPRK